MAQKVKISTIKDWIKGKCSVNDVPLEVKKYLSFKEKLSLIDKVVRLSLVKSDSGVAIINHAFKQFFYELELVRAYTNIDFSTIDKSIDNAEEYLDKLIEFYDLLKKNGKLDYILGLIPTDEKVYIKNRIEEQIVEQQKIENSISMMIGQLINTINEKIPQMEETIKNFKPEDFKFVVEALKANNSL